MPRKGGVPENLKRWPKGQTGNPNGRPPMLPDIKKVMAEALGAERNGKSGAQILITKLFTLAQKGNVKAAEMLLDRGYGKAVQAMQLSGPDGGPLKLSYEPDKLPSEFKEG
jgi:hypothetical protein